MNQLTQSPFLQALGYAIINSLWQFALVWLVYILLGGVFRLSSHQKSGAAITLQFTGFAWFIGTVVFYYQQCSELAPGVFALTTQNPNASPSNSITSGKEWLLNFVLEAEKVLPYLSLAYIVLLVLLLVKTVQCYRKTLMIRTQGLEKISVEWRLFVQRLSLQLGIKRKVSIYLSTVIDSPLTIGFVKPLILLPVGIITNLNAVQIEAVLLHELAHIKRNDYFINLLLSLAEVTLFFNPFMQLMSRQIKRERENCCDDWVLQYQYSAASYAKALLTIAKNRKASTPFLAMHAADNNKALLTRVKRMIEKKDYSFNYRHQLITLGLITGLISSMAWLTGSKPVHTTLVTQSIAKKAEPLAARIKNPLFNPVFFLAEDKTEVKQSKTQNLPSAQLKNNIASLGNTHRTAISTKKYSLNQFSNPLVDPNKILQAGAQFLKGNLEDTLPATKFRTVVKKEVTVDWEKIEKELNKVKRELESAEANSFAPEKIQHQMLLALRELKKMQMQFDVNKDELVTHAFNGEQMQKSTEERKQKEKYKLPQIELKRLAEDIKEQLLALEQQKNVLRHNVDFALLLELPHLANDKKESENWSYTYSRRPRQVLTQEKKMHSPCKPPTPEIKTMHAPGKNSAEKVVKAEQSCAGPTTVKKVEKRILVVRI
jgi:beta-lactamase regulating signal transducer with metallopeptidase domain